MYIDIGFMAAVPMFFHSGLDGYFLHRAVFEESRDVGMACQFSIYIQRLFFAKNYYFFNTTTVPKYPSGSESLDIS